MTDNKLNLLCFSHLRWNFVFQRPQHLLTRASENYNIFFIEEPVFHSTDKNYFNETIYNDVTVLTPMISSLAENAGDTNEIMEELIKDEINKRAVTKYISWYYTPMALEFTESLEPETIIYDCMDELSAFHGAPPGMIENERRLLEKADIVFTGGRSLFDAKKDKHKNAHLFPSSIDTHHFSTDNTQSEPQDQIKIKNPKIGFFGVVDERFDIKLLDTISQLKPDWNFIIIGPVVKISEDVLPRRENIFYLGQKDYADLPGYIHGWNAAIIPFAKNDSTKFISPTKVLEYLAAGKRVVSTSINDIVFPYSVNDIVKIADTPEEFISSLEACFKNENDPEWNKNVKILLSNTSWEKTWREMHALIERTLKNKKVISQYTKDSNTNIINEMEGVEYV
jgi:UDP-galactopyranose mutase